jgi:hypothetical protein
MENARRLTARLAREFYERKISFRDFLKQVPDEGTDQDISELIDLIEHEPARGGFMGVSPEEHDSYLEAIKELIERLSE